MKYYLGDKFLFIDMNTRYTHCVVEGEDRILTCQQSEEKANEVCRNIRQQRMVKLGEMKELLELGHEYSSAKKTASGIDLRELYPTAGLLAAAIRRMDKTIHSIRVVPLTVKE